MIRIATWGEGLKSTRTQQWMIDNIDMLELYAHVEDILEHGLDAPLEFFTCSSEHGGSVWTMRGALHWCRSENKTACVNVDAHHGNGRQDSQTAVGPGRYHNSIHEGDMVACLQRVKGWRSQFPEIVAVQLMNEQDTPDEWFEELCRKARGIFPRGLGVKIVIGGDRSDIAVGAEWADVIDPHLLRSDWRGRLDWARGLAQWDDRAVWCSEMAPPLDMPFPERLDEYDHMLDRVYNECQGAGVFVGNDEFKAGPIHWNFRDQHSFIANNKEGETLVGRMYRGQFSGGGSSVAITNEEVAEKLARLRAELARVENKIIVGRPDENPPRLRGRLDELKDWIQWLEMFVK